MAKPTQYEIDTARDVLEYCIDELNVHEPYAVNTIEDFESVLGNIPDEDDMRDI